jgi:hypothetical protein
MDIGPMLKVDLLREPKLFFQIFDQLLEALGGDGVVKPAARLACSSLRSSRSLF